MTFGCHQAVAALAMLAVAAPAPAQTARPMLDYATAAKVRDGCLAWAGERGLKVAVAVYDASKETANWGNGPASLATWEGGTPIFTPEGTALGGVGVSGASGAEDGACGEAGIAAAGMAPRGG